MRMKVTWVAATAFVALTHTAFAQAPPTPATPPARTATPAPSTNSTACAPHDTSGSKETTSDKRKEPLGEKLAKSDGVLCPPPGVDPDIRAPTPEGGNTPIIPPPGSPGGDPTVRPK
jgi:hypothetical protein